MCGRFTLARPQALAAAFPRFRFPEFSETRLPRYNVAPTQAVLGVRNDGRDVADDGSVRRIDLPAHRCVEPIPHLFVTSPPAPDRGRRGPELGKARL